MSRPSARRGVVGQELEGDREQDRLQLGLGGRNHDRGRDTPGSASGELVTATTGPPRAWISAIEPMFLSHSSSLGGDDHGRDVGAHEGQGAVLELGGRVGLGVHVGDLLQLLGTLEGDVVAAHPSDVEGARGRGEVLGRVGDGVLAGEHLCDLSGQSAEGPHEPATVGRAHVADASEVESQEGQDDGGRRERLRRSDRHLGPGVEVDPRAALAGDGAARGVDDAEDPASFALDLLDRGQGVEGLTRLADGDVEGVGLDDRVAVAELRGGLGIGRDAGEALDQLGADEAGVEGGAASEDLDTA